MKYKAMKKKEAVVEKKHHPILVQLDRHRATLKADFCGFGGRKSSIIIIVLKF